MDLNNAAETVQDFHANSDRDAGKFSQHHTLGVEPNQASPGNHVHDGGTSKQLLSGSSVAGATSEVALQNLITLLANKFGLTDETNF
jgi:hypothetical protein